MGFAILVIQFHQVRFGEMPITTAKLRWNRAVIGAFIWDKFVYFTNIQFGLVAVGVGFIVGVGVAMGASGKSSVALQAMGALLACAGMLLGQGLIIMDVVKHELAKQSGYVPFISLLFASIKHIPAYLAGDPLTLLFIAIGVYEGWKIPGGRGQGE